MKARTYENRPTTSRARVRRAWATSAVVALGLVALITVGGNNWHTVAAGNRFVATSGNDSANDCSNPASPCATIQHAATVGVELDTVQVAAGTYFENVAFGGKNLTIHGAGAGTTIVNGGGAGPVFSFGFAGLTVTDLTITNGNAHSAQPQGDQGGGIDCTVGVANVIRCTITGNHATKVTSGGKGGGIFCDGGLTVTDSTISGNSADAAGGGIYASGATSISSTTISGNSVAQGNGGGVFLDHISTLTLSLTNTTISGNSATGSGGGIYSNSSVATITNCTIKDNSGAQGGGIFGAGVAPQS